jgi:hypothetical protein
MESELRSYTAVALWTGFFGAQWPAEDNQSAALKLSFVLGCRTGVVCGAELRFTLRVVHFTQSVAH